MFKINNALYKKKAGWFKKDRVFPVIILAALMTFIIEVIGRKSLITGLGFIIKNPVMYFFNMFIILLTLSLSYLFTRRKFVTIIISSVWLGLGIVNGIVLCFRLTPLSAMDFYDITSMIYLIPEYLNLWQIICVILLVLLFIWGILVLFKKSKISSVSFKIGIPVILATGILLYLLSFTASKMNILSNHFDNLHDAYKEYGFVYCFTNSIFDRGIDKPHGYTNLAMNEILEDIRNGSNQIYTENKESTEEEIKEFPNIIMVQLESFFDPSLLKNYGFSENPVPNFTRLKKEYTSGYLTVPVYGAGTVNTEFEVITGMNSRFFGTGEYPYRTVLASSTCESICYNLSKLGFHNYVIHNNAASFYKRNEVFKMLGFDNFISMEYMDNIELNPIGWAKDRILTEEIRKALNAKDTKDFIYAISVQDHGIYPDTGSNENNKIKAVIKQDKVPEIDGNKGSESYIGKIEYYVNQVYDTDKFIGDLIQALNDFNEPTVVVFYGDHLPPLSFENKDLENDRYKTEYVLWSNFSMEKERHDLTAYQLNAYVLARLGIEEGILTRLHQTGIHNTKYEKHLKLLQYDMLYGKKYVYNGVNPYPVKDMQMGINNQTITRVVIKEDKIFVYGENFTPWSKIYVGEDQIDTQYLDVNTLTMEKEDITGKDIYVAQVTDDNIVLSKSAPWK